MTNEEKQKTISADYHSLINGIPADTAKDVLPDKLEPLLRLLAENENFAKAWGVLKAIVKDRFGLAIEDIKHYFRVFKEYKNQAERTKNREATEDSVERKIELLTRDIKYEEVWQAISKIGVTSSHLLEIIMASCISSCIKFSVPIWLIIIGSPSSLKTELVRLLKALPNVYFLSTLSENAFASGFIPPDGSPPKDLLPNLDGRTLLIRDLTTLFSLNEETVKKILGDLTSIFDGEFEKFTATRGLMKYRASFAMIACITPAILNKHHSYVHQLGSRFLFVRTPKLTERARQQGYQIAWSKEDRKRNIQEATILVSSYCKQAIDKIEKGETPIIEDEEVQKWLNAASDFIARARGIVMGKIETFKNEEGKDIEYYEIEQIQIEEPWRALNQLRNLSIALAALRGKRTVTIEDCGTLIPVVIATAPINRAEIVDQLLRAEKSTAKDIAKTIEKSDKTVRRKLKELCALELIDVIEEPIIGGQWPLKNYFLKNSYKQMLGHDSTPSPDFLSAVNPSESPPIQTGIFDEPDAQRAYKED